jgi:hypothetical protein
VRTLLGTEGHALSLVSRNSLGQRLRGRRPQHPLEGLRIDRHGRRRLTRNTGEIGGEARHLAGAPLRHVGGHRAHQLAFLTHQAHQQLLVLVAAFETERPAISPVRHDRGFDIQHRDRLLDPLEIDGGEVANQAFEEPFKVRHEAPRKW